ncbi:MAG TPA: oligosaccharide flippase family protein, partial [Solirubrobacterales bacterium]|nr:oligosaccharide flippase family protein [Solirubrobacterales bacterium]
RLSSGLLIIKNTAIQVAAQALIAIVALIAVPILVDRLGTERFGILSLTWVVIGYASLLDLGLGRALTKMTAERLGAGEAGGTPRLFWTAILMLGSIGVATGAALALSSGLLTNDVFSIKPDLTGEAQATFILIACTVPFVLCSTALRGSLEAHQRFDLTNAAAVPLSLLSYFGPVAIALFTDNLAVVVSAVCLSRVAGTAVFLYLCLRVDPLLRTKPSFDRSMVGTLLRFGGWVTVAAILTGVMLSLDRLIIGAAVSASAVAWYATSYEGAKQMLLVSTAFSSVLFPGFAANVHLDRERTELLFSRGARATFVGLFPLALIASVLSHEILEVWINAEFATEGGPVLRLLAIGVLINGLAFVAYALIQSTRPDVIAKLVAAELPLYLALLWVLLETTGITGAAVAVCLRAIGDTSALYYLTNRLGLVRAAVLIPIAAMTAIGVVVIGIGALAPSAPLRIAYVLVVIAAFLPVAWRRILAEPERERIVERLGALRGSRRKRSAAGVV